MQPWSYLTLNFSFSIQTLESLIWHDSNKTVPLFPTYFPLLFPEEEEEEEDESDDEGQELSLPSDAAAVLGEESLEPPAKLARTDQRVLFATGSAEN